MAKSWRSVCMWAWQRVLDLLFERSNLSLMLTLTWGNCEGTCSDYNWDSWALCIALHASRNVVQSLNRLETIQAIEHPAVHNLEPTRGLRVHCCYPTTLQNGGEYPEKHILSSIIYGHAHAGKFLVITLLLWSMHAKGAAAATTDHKFITVFLRRSTKSPIHSLCHAVEVVPQPSYVTSLCESAIECP